jgi:uncharacterized protein YcbK (DUF882 family)
MSASANFTDAELRCRCGCGVNLCTDMLVNALETLRADLGLPVGITSGYRCAEHNRAVGGEPNSYHLRGLAADVTVKGMAPVHVYEVARKIPAFGGFGLASTFLHVDVRTSRARWKYFADGKQRDWQDEDV